MREFEITVPFGREPRLDDIRSEAARVLRLRNNAVINVIDPTKSYQPAFSRCDAVCRIVRRSMDARHDVKSVYRIEAFFAREWRGEPELPEYQDVSDADEVVVIGAGPAGMFAALRLLAEGLKPVIIERGKNVHARKSDMAALSRTGVVNPDSNYCYGEGGAGAFSDGKLYTRSSKRGNIHEVLKQLVEFGADRSILVDAHPHIGTDRLPRVVENIRRCITSHGGEYHFDTKVVDINKLEDGSFDVVTERSGTSHVKDGADSVHTDAQASLGNNAAATVGNDNAEAASGNKSQEAERRIFHAKAVILATGHSARDIYEMFQNKGWELQPKGFAMGVRVEHPQSLINRIRYRGQWEPGMPAAEYSFVEQVDDRGVFSFCMCPGGILVPSSTEPETIVLNGMSNSARNSKWANAGVVVSIEPGDEPEEYKNDGPFALLNFQKDVERKMYAWAKAAYNAVPEVIDDEEDFDSEDEDAFRNPMAAPAQRMIDFCNGVRSHDLPATSYHPGVISAPLHELLPEHIVTRLQKAFPEVSRHGMRGYFTNDALLLAVESRTSSPVRITRDPDTLSVPQAPGLFPCGEGAGYSGGIVSSALDGINCAIAASRFLHPEADAETAADEWAGE